MVVVFLISALLAEPPRGNPLAPTPLDVIEVMLSRLSLTEDDLVYDLGCGDGRVLMVAAKRYGCACIGVEIDPEIAERARQNVLASGLSPLIAIFTADATKFKCADASLVYMYLPVEVMEKVKLVTTGLRPGATIISHFHKMPGWPSAAPVRILSREDGQEHAFYLWRVLK